MSCKRNLQKHLSIPLFLASTVSVFSCLKELCQSEHGPIRIQSKIMELSFAGPVFIIFLLITEGFKEQR